MKITRRNAIFSGLGTGAAAIPLIGCAGAAEPKEGETRIHVLGTIHSGHEESDRYSLDVLRAAIRKAAPDIVLTEIPPDRIEQAISSFRTAGIVDEPRTRVFPEYTKVLFPLSRDMRFEIRGTAGWTRQIADNRRAALVRIQNDPARAEQWAQHRSAQRAYSREINGRGDDPLFIHTHEFDVMVEASRRPYERFFDADLGAGGWSQINRAHTNLINSALDQVSGQGRRVLVTFGTAHKYKILRSLAERSDIFLENSRALFT